ncbi:MAG: N5-carboxyaminoimidazole ribonucleotide synthase [Deltaproteobacteria bacterium]|jgi:5-(carboxyamino)imidazole ribonucleotide synthase|nr:N5-carboxyaminoimidazole ribonucleotide synthase [Deltaproteobacteria bacterium]
MNSVPEPLQPGALIGILGGGQLAQMLVLAGHAMSFRFMVLDPNPNCPAALAGAEQITANYDDRHALTVLADSCKVVTFEFENVDAHAVAWLEERVDLPQGSQILRISQNRLKEKAFLERLKIPIAPYKKISTVNHLSQAFEQFDKLILKTATGGYDGKGQVLVSGSEQIPHAFNELHDADTEIVAEQYVPFEKEVSVIVARNRLGEVRCFPVAENLHQKNILIISRIPARLIPAVAEQAQIIAKQVAEGLDLKGVLCIEMFVLADGELVVNELAPRPHNSGHFTQNACATSQFEQHIRAITNLPLGLTDTCQSAVMLNILGQHLPLLLKKLKHLPPEAKLHLYGKQETRTGRKMGHLNFVSESPDTLLKSLIKLGIWEESLLTRML